MVQTQNSRGGTKKRAMKAVLDVLPRSLRMLASAGDSSVDLSSDGRRLEIRWIGEGRLSDVRVAISDSGDCPDIVVGRQLSPGAREALSKAGIGWVDETGAAEVAVGSIIISRTGRAPKPVERSKRWTPAVFAATEALLCGTKATVSEVHAATGLSTGSCTNALRVLSDLDLLESDADRGRGSARRLSDLNRVLEVYAAAAAEVPEKLSLQVGVAWRDPIAGLVEVGRKWDSANLQWASTGIAAASVIAPYLTTVTSTKVYVDADTIVGLESVAADVGLRPIQGGRLTLLPFPTVAVRRLATEVERLRVAPWPRVFVDLRKAGVRGEEAAEHLREVLHGS